MTKGAAGVHSGSSFDDFLEEEGYRNDVESVAIKRVLTWQFEQEMIRQQKTRRAMAAELKTAALSWTACLIRRTRQFRSIPWRGPPMPWASVWCWKCMRSRKDLAKKVGRSGDGNCPGYDQSSRKEWRLVCSPKALPEFSSSRPEIINISATVGFVGGHSS